MEQADAFTKTNSGKRICARRRETIERSFAEAKELHGLRYASMLGIRSMYEQSFLTAAVQSMKRIARAFRFPFSLRVSPAALKAQGKRVLSEKIAAGELFRQAVRGSFLWETAPMSAARPVFVHLLRRF